MLFLLKNDPAVLSKIASSPEYSSVFKVVLTPVKESEEFIAGNSCKYTWTTLNHVVPLNYIAGTWMNWKLHGFCKLRGNVFIIVLLILVEMVSRHLKPIIKHKDNCLHIWQPIWFKGDMRVSFLNPHMSLSDKNVHFRTWKCY